MLLCRSMWRGNVIRIILGTTYRGSRILIVDFSMCVCHLRRDSHVAKKKKIKKNTQKKNPEGFCAVRMFERGPV